MGTCSISIGSLRYTWDVKTLWELSKDVPPTPKSLCDFSDLLDDRVWGWKSMTPNNVLEHYERIVESDLHYPLLIIGNPRLEVLDGYHRLVKAKYKGYEKIMVKVLPLEEIIKEGAYLHKEELYCEACGCIPCDCYWGEC